MLETLERFRQGEGESRDIVYMELLADTMAQASLCGLGQAAPFSVLDTLKYFRDEYNKICVIAGGEA